MTDFHPALEIARRMADLPLFAARAPSVNGSVTSAQAAESLKPETLNRLHKAVLAYIAGRCDGCTDEEIASALGMNPSTARPRRIELLRRGLIEQAGTRRTTSGRMAVVWQATAASR